MRGACASLLLLLSLCGGGARAAQHAASPVGAPGAGAWVVIAVVSLAPMMGFAHRAKHHHTIDRCPPHRLPPGEAPPSVEVLADAALMFPNLLVAPVVVHVLRGSDQVTANVPLASIEKNVNAMNLAHTGGRVGTYAPSVVQGATPAAASNITFYLLGVDYWDNDEWSQGCAMNSIEEEAREATAINPASTLNIWTCNMGNNYLGWTYFPSTSTEDSVWRGPMLFYGTFPPSPGYIGMPPYDEGMTMVHEVGHYFGLEHPFSGGCVAPGDFVNDTPPEAAAYYGDCMAPSPSCDGDQPLVPDFMDYTIDACMDRFTAGQVQRMQEQAVTYLPTLLAMNKQTRCVTGGSFGPASPMLLCDGSGACLMSPSPDGGAYPWCKARGTIVGLWGDCICVSDSTGVQIGSTARPTPPQQSRNPSPTTQPPTLSVVPLLDAGTCSRSLSFASAVKRCRKLKARLCKVAEVEAGVLSGEACLATASMWTGDKCPSNKQAFTVYGSSPFYPSCTRRNDKRLAPCCKNQSPPSRS